MTALCVHDLFNKFGASASSAVHLREFELILERRLGHLHITAALVIAECLLSAIMGILKPGRRFARKRALDSVIAALAFNCTMSYFLAL